jgi:2-keto-4-pentenoate hydratase
MADPRVQRGMEAQLGRWRVLVAGGAPRVGWKIGLTDPHVQRHLGLEGPVVGHLTLATTLVPGMSHSLTGATKVGVEPEVAIHLGRDVPPDADRAYCEAAILGLGPALELVDIDGPFDDLERIVARNIFHRGVLFGITHPERAGGSHAGVTVRTFRNHAVVETVDAAGAGDLAELVRLVAGALGACGERLLAGDRIISGALTQPVWVEPGDVVSADLQPLGTLAIRFTA